MIRRSFLKALLALPLAPACVTWAAPKLTRSAFSSDTEFVQWCMDNGVVLPKDVYHIDKAIVLSGVGKTFDFGNSQIVYSSRHSLILECQESTIQNGHLTDKWNADHPGVYARRYLVEQDGGKLTYKEIS